MVRHYRLSFLMFLHYFSLGAITPIFSLYLTKVLHFQGGEAGLILAAGSLAAVLSPILGAVVADRLVSGSVLFSLLNFASAVFFFLLAGSQDFLSVLVYYTLAMTAKGPTFALSNSITFQNISDRQRHFPVIRLWGTLGWISVGWFFSFFWLGQSGPNLLVAGITLSAVASALLGFYGLTLPRMKLFRPDPLAPASPPTQRQKLTRDLLVFLVVTVILSAADKFYFFGAGLWLNQGGWPERWILPVMSIGQITEVAAMMVLSWLLPRLGFRRVFLVGVVWQILRFAILAWAQVPWQAVVGIACHGLAFTFFFANAFVYIDSRTVPANRARIHQLYMILVEGVGVTVGNGFAGLTSQLATGSGGQIDFWAYWAVPGLSAVACLGLMAVFFRPQALPQPAPPSS